MGSYHRTCECLRFSRSWRTIFNSLQSPRLVMVLILVYVFNSHSQARYIHDENITYYTFNCNGTAWCGEQWRPNRILRYGYNITDTLVKNSSTSIVHENECSGAVASSDCNSSSTTETTEHKLYRKRVVIRDSQPEITTLSATNLFLITTKDSVNKTSSNSTSYSLNQDIIWQLQIPKNCRMIVYFSLFDLQKSERCEKDSFSVQTSRNQTDIYRYCDSLHKIEIRRRRRVQMTFHSDTDITRGGIKAAACLTSLHNRESASRLDEHLPCTCHLDQKIRRASQKSKRTRPTPAMRRKIAKEDAQVGEWLTRMMREGQEAIDAILKQPVNFKQRHLAEQYQAALSKHTEW